MIILAHRSNYNGPVKVNENSLASVKFCFEQGWGIEIDIRRAPGGGFYISHDPVELSMENQADAFCELIRDFPSATVALNIKELGYESDLLQYLDKQRVKQNMFIFDMELLEPQAGKTARLLRELDSEVQLAARVSDRGESLDQALSITPAEFIWLDEFDQLWVKESDVKRLKFAGKKIFTVSPEIHGFSLFEMEKRWREYYYWGVDGICTDYSMLLAKKLALGFKDIP